MSRYYRNTRRSSATREPRWLTVRYAGTCKVCAKPIPVGAQAFYDPAGTLTCAEIECAKADGLTRDVWHGSPVSGSWVPQIAERRIGSHGYVRDPGEDAADRWAESQR